MKKSQKQNVLEYLQAGKTITPVKALAEFSVMRLSAIIYTLRAEGYRITSERKYSVSGKPYAEYGMASNAS